MPEVGPTVPPGPEPYLQPDHGRLRPDDFAAAISDGTRLLYRDHRVDGTAPPGERRHRPDHARTVPEGEWSGPDTANASFFDDRRRDEENLVLERPGYRNAKVLATAPDFGSGSSREHAPGGLQDWGFEAVIAPSFADIFFSDCTKIGSVPVVLSGKEAQ